MKILINCPSKFNLNSNTLNKIGGIESLNIELAKNLSKLNFDITFATHCNKKTKIRKILILPIKFIKLKKKKLNFDFIISSNDATIFNYFPNSKKILWLHNPLQIEKSIRKKQFLPILFNRPKVVFVSSYLKSITSRLFFFKKEIIISNFLLPIFTNQNINYGRKQIFVWSVQRTMGLNETIEVWIKNISPLYPDAEFHIFGIRKCPNNLNKKKLKSKNIFFRGRVDKIVLKNTYNKSLAMICLGYDETFCLNALEANSCGLPILTFGKTALGDYVQNNYNGLIVNNYQNLSLIIIKMLNMNKKNHNELIINSVNTSKKYHMKKITKNWLKLFI